LVLLEIRISVLGAKTVQNPDTPENPDILDINLDNPGSAELLGVGLFG